MSDDEEEEIVNQNLESVKDNKIHTNHVFRNSANISSQEIFSKEQDDEHAGVKIRVCDYQIIYYNLNFIIKLFSYIFLCFPGHDEELILDRQIDSILISKTKKYYKINVAEKKKFYNIE